ncbi:MAG: restriction endonuclease, partial [Bacteroidia bacterium]|nr:restriction endonuclease [Bacteroidia bacterium]
MIDMADIKPESALLEPCAGKGTFVRCLKERGFHNVIAYEVDPELARAQEGIIRESFVSADITEKFDLVIGNPPHVYSLDLNLKLRNEVFASELWNRCCNLSCNYLFIFLLK